MVKTDFSTDISWKNFPNSWKENRYNGEKKMFLGLSVKKFSPKKEMSQVVLSIILVSLLHIYSRH